jgi:hypothetical protein
MADLALQSSLVRIRKNAVTDLMGLQCDNRQVSSQPRSIIQSGEIGFDSAQTQ